MAIVIEMGGCGSKKQKVLDPEDEMEYGNAPALVTNKVVLMMGFSIYMADALIIEMTLDVFVVDYKCDIALVDDNSNLYFIGMV